ncbi:2-oxoglutarate dehydrogenase E1 subunit family protein, partial [Streptomyces mayteni]
MSPQSPNTPSVDTDQAAEKNPAAGFGANEWLVDEIYQQYLQDPNSVDRAWWDFFADYRPGTDGAAPAKATKADVSGPSAATAAPATPAPAAPRAAAP